MKPAPGGAEAFEQIRSLLLGDTNHRLDAAVERVEKIDARVGDEEKFALSVSHSLVAALKRAEESQPRDLSAALAPSVVSIIRAEIRNSKDMMIEALYPIMGRLVTASVAGAFRDLVESLNARIDALVSANSWRLRLRAMATGRTLAEVALAESEAGRLKRALLLERGGGRLLAIWPPMEEGGGQSKGNADLESGMIAAITEFAANVYAETGGELRMLDLGSGKVFLRASPRVIVAGEFGGELSRQRETRLNEAFLTIVESYEKDADACAGDTIGELLNGALTEPAARAKSKLPVAIFGVVLAGLAIWFAWEPTLRSWRERRIQAAFETAMAEHPALAQYPLRLDVEHGARRVVLRGLAANDSEPQAVAEALAPVAEPYRVERDVAIVAPASRVEELRAELDRTRATLERLVADQDAPRAKLRRYVDSFAVFFTDNDNLLNPAGVDASLDELASLINSSDSGLRVVGYADEVGAQLSNRAISRKRAERVVSMLVARGVPKERLALVSRSTFNPIADSALDKFRSRRVSFEMPYAGEFDVR
jgi:outer membrane protein OmpA-like peptidoglycan-associated protein